MNNTNTETDLNGDGVVDKREYALYENKWQNRRGMAWVALIAMIVTAFAVLFFVPENKLDRIKDMLDLYWISLGGIVGAYVGISTWVSKN